MTVCILFYLWACVFMVASPISGGFTLCHGLVSFPSDGPDEPEASAEESEGKTACRWQFCLDFLPPISHFVAEGPFFWFLIAVESNAFDSSLTPLPLLQLRRRVKQRFRHPAKRKTRIPIKSRALSSIRLPVTRSIPYYSLV